MQENNGYEINFNISNCGFGVAFKSLCDAVNFCCAVQMQLLLIQWPDKILTSSPYAY